MSCSSKSTRKRKLETPECKKPAKKRMAWDSLTSIQDFGYKFNEDGRLVNIEDGSGFNFYVDPDHRYNQQNYEALGEVITEYVYELLQSEEVGLKKLEIPLPEKPSSKKKEETPKGFIFVSEDYEKQEKLLVLVHGSGVVRAGQWARRLIINDCLDHGTQIPYIKRAIKDGYGVVVTNTNQRVAQVEIKGTKTYKAIKESESPEKHFSYVWKNIIEKTEASKIFAVAHSYGGHLVVNYFGHFPKILERVVAVAFTDSVHSLNSNWRSNARQWFLQNSVNWATSENEIDTPMLYQDDKNHTTRVSAGTTRHEETSWKAMESIFKYFQIQEVDFNKKKSEAGKCERNSPDNKTKNKAEIAKEYNSEKSKEKNSDITTGLLGTTNDPKKSKNGIGEDGIYSVIEKHDEAFEEVKEIEKTDGSESAQDGSESSEQKSEDDLDEIHENALKSGQEKSYELKEVKNKESDHEQSGYSPGQDKKASKHKLSQAEGRFEPNKASYNKKQARATKKAKRSLKKAEIKKLKKAGKKSNSNDQKSENAIEHEPEICDKFEGVDSKSLELPGQDEESEEALKNTKDLKGNDAIVSGSSKTEDGSEVAEASVDTVEISTEVYKETRLIKQKSEGDFRKEALKAGQETPGEVKDASNKEAGDNRPDSDPRQDGKYEEGEDALKIIEGMKDNVVIASGSLKTGEASKPDKVGDETKGPNTEEMSTELNKETTSSEKKTEGDTFKTGPGTPDKINDANNSGACDSHPENSPEQDGKSMDRKEEILDSEDLGKKKAVDAGPNTEEMSTELNKETTLSEKKTEGDTFKTGPGTPDEINDPSNSGACDNHPENSPEQDGKSMEGKEEILDGEDLGKKKAVDAGPNTEEMSTELNKETTSSEKKTEGDTFKTGPGTPDEINVASNSGACDNHPENSPEQDGQSMEGKEEILDGEDLSKKAIDAKCVSSGAGGATENQPAVSAPSNSNSGANIIEPEGGEPSDEVVSSKQEEADNSSENGDPSKIEEADMVGKPVTEASEADKPPQTGNLEQANFVETSNGQDENGKNADKSTVLGETKNDGNDGTPASGAGTMGENLGSDQF